MCEGYGGSRTRFTPLCCALSLQKWRKFWGVLYKESACATARVELLEGSGPPSVERSRRAESSKRLIKLTDCVYVGEARGEASGPKETVPFLLETTEKCYLLAAERAEAEGWILELCELAFSVRTCSGCNPNPLRPTLQFTRLPVRQWHVCALA